MQYISRSTRAKAKHEAQWSRDHRNYVMRSSIDYKGGAKLWYRGLRIRSQLGHIRTWSHVMNNQ